MSNTWQPIRTVPKDGTVVDLWVPQLGRVTEQWWDDDCWIGIGLCAPELEPTHWMPYTDPPQDEKTP